MTFLYVVLVLASAVMLTAGIAEQRQHYRHLHSIPTRVLVNGIRGKSSITRLCAGALRGGGLVTTAQDHRHRGPVHPSRTAARSRSTASSASPTSSSRSASSAARPRTGPDALVIECMAVMPDLQEINQSKLIQSTIGVLCNVREDHLAEMGPTLDDVARSLSRSMPVGGICLTAEQDRLHILQEEAAKRDCELIAVDPETVTDEEMQGFSWITFKENVAIALAVADLLNVNRQLALEGMWAAPPDPGVLQVHQYRAGRRHLRFANVFAANDPESTLMNIDQLRRQGAISDPLHVIINCRPDRVERNGQMGALIPRIAPERVVLIGEPTRSARAAIPSEWHDRVVDLGGSRSPRELLRGIIGGVGRHASLIAIGNIHGQGELLIEELAKLEPVA